VLCCGKSCTVLCCGLQESKCGPISVPYNSFESALTVPPAQLTLSTHPMYHVLQGNRACFDFQDCCDAS